jgi:hypothetical protein
MAFEDTEMAKQLARTGAAFVMAMILLSARLVSAQGWPGESETKSVKSPVVKAPTTAAAAKPAAAPKPAAKPAAKTDAAPKAEVKKAEPVAKAEPKPAPIVVPAPVKTSSTSSEVIDALQQQSAILKRLADEMEAQRTVIKEQQDKIKALELKATGAGASLSTAPAVKAAAPPPPPAILVDTAGMKLRVSGLFQGWYSASDAAVVDTFRLRRAEIKFSGDISPRVKWVLMVDPAKALSLTNTTGSMGGQTVLTNTSVAQSGRMLQDAFVSLGWTKSLTVEVGQQKVPLGMEGTASSGKLDVVERALFMTDKARGGPYADIRDLGVLVRGKLAGGQVEFAGGVFNGLGEAFNDVDRNEDKTMVGRITAKPTFIKGLQVGASMARDKADLFNDIAREREGVELAYARGFFGFKSEYMAGRDAAITRQGGYAQVTARLTKKFTTVARFDAWDPDTRTEKTAATVTERDWLGGFTYVLHPSGVWLQANYIRKTFDGVSPSRNVFMTNVQTAW